MASVLIAANGPGGCTIAIFAKPVAYPVGEYQSSCTFPSGDPSVTTRHVNVVPLPNTCQNWSPHLADEREGLNKVDDLDLERRLHYTIGHKLSSWAGCQIRQTVCQNGDAKYRD